MAPKDRRGSWVGFQKAGLDLEELKMLKNGLN